MAIKDVFNNSNNNYLKTGLSPCTGDDSNIFQFFPKKEVGVINGSQVLQSLNLGDIQIEVTAWDQHKKVIEPGEVMYVQGLTKEIQNRSQTFSGGFLISDASHLYMGATFNINYNKNFKNYDSAIEASANYVQGTDILNAIDLALNSLGIKVTSDIDASSLTFTGIDHGYDFNVSSVQLNFYDASLNLVSNHSLNEDTSKNVPYANYINGAMLGVVIKNTYPSEQSTYDSWLYINHVNNTFSYFDGSIYLTKYVDTGSLPTSTSTTICAGDYLNYITENNLWDKMGYLYAKVNTFDQHNTDPIIKNLVPGFYVFNPHDFSVEIDYLMIN